jgi:hypothetical protein
MVDKNDEKFEMPTLRSAAPEYAELTDRRAKLQSDRDNCAALIGKLQRQRYAALRGSENDIEKVHARRVEAIAAGRSPVEASGSDPRSIKQIDDQQTDAEESLRELDGALRLVDGEIFRARMAASAVIREQIRPEHERLVAAICKQMIELHRANLAYHEFAAKCNAAEISWSALEPMFARFLGTPAAGSKLADYLKMAAKAGFIEPEQIPAELR